LFLFVDLGPFWSLQRQLLSEDRPRIKFGTSVFHAYVHNWTCQLDYHPRFNKAWGLSDGEGLERMWSYLSQLVSPLRYSTRNHRLAAISHRLAHHNKRGMSQLCKCSNIKFTGVIKTYLPVYKPTGSVESLRRLYNAGRRLNLR
jgi:hypothetical protein